MRFLNVVRVALTLFALSLASDPAEAQQAPEVRSGVRPPVEDHEEPFEETGEREFLFLLEEAYLQEPRELQIGIGGTLARGDAPPPGAAALTGNAWGLEVEFGLVERLQIALEVPYGGYAAPGSTSSPTFGDPEFELGLGLLEAESSALSLLGGVTLGDEREWEIGLSAARLLHERATIYGTFGLEFEGEEDDGFPVVEEDEEAAPWTAGLALALASSEESYWVVEAGRGPAVAESAPTFAEGAPWAFSVGWVRSLVDDLDLGLAVGLIRSEGMDARHVSLELRYER